MLTNLLARMYKSKTLTYPVLILQPQQAVVSTVSGPSWYLRVFPVTGSMLSLEYAWGRTTNNFINNFLYVFGMEHINGCCQLKLHMIQYTVPRAA